MTEIKDVDLALMDKWYSEEFLALPRSAWLAFILTDAAAHREAAEKAERDRIVAWFRKVGSTASHGVFLDAIERGEHLK